MGAWDTGIFDDDTAYDVLASLAIADPMAQINEWYAAVKVWTTWSTPIANACW